MKVVIGNSVSFRAGSMSSKSEREFQEKCEWWKGLIKLVA
jgi:hypothetical protein